MDENLFTKSGEGDFVVKVKSQNYLHSKKEIRNTPYQIRTPIHQKLANLYKRYQRLDYNRNSPTQSDKRIVINSKQIKSTISFAPVSASHASEGRKNEMNETFDVKSKPEEKELRERARPLCYSDYASFGAPAIEMIEESKLQEIDIEDKEGFRKFVHSRRKLSLDNDSEYITNYKMKIYTNFLD